jgi:hypothetical protein
MEAGGVQPLLKHRYLIFAILALPALPHQFLGGES